MIEPLKVESGTLFLGKLNSQLGTLVLLPDRIAFVPLEMRIGAVFGAIGMLLAQRSARKSASARAVEGGKDVITVALDALRMIERGSQGLNKNVLVISSPAGALKVGVKYDKWAPAISDAARSAGRHCTVAPERIEFT